MRCDIRFSFRLVVLDPVPGEKWRSFQKFILHVNTSQSGVSENHHLIYLIDNPLKFVFIVLPTCTSLNTHLQKRSLSNIFHSPTKSPFWCVFLWCISYISHFLVQKTSSPHPYLSTSPLQPSIIRYAEMPNVKSFPVPWHHHSAPPNVAPTRCRRLAIRIDLVAWLDILSLKLT